MHLDKVHHRHRPQRGPAAPHIGTSVNTNTTDEISSQLYETNGLPQAQPVQVVPTISHPRFFGNGGILQTLALQYWWENSEQVNERAKTLQGTIWEELVQPVAEKWLLEQKILTPNFPFLIQLPSHSKLDFQFKTRQNENQWAFAEVKSTHGKPDDMVINVSKFENLRGTLFVIDCTSVGVGIMRCDNVEDFRRTYKTHYHQKWKCWVHYIPHTDMIQIALSKELDIDSSEQLIDLFTSEYSKVM